MIIIATAVINSSNMIEKAGEVVDTTNLKNIQDMADVAWTEAYHAGAKTGEELRIAVKMLYK